MSEEKRQNIMEINTIMAILNEFEIATIKEEAEKIVDKKLLELAPDAIIENMNITEKIMLIDREENKERIDEEESIPLEKILKEEGFNELYNQYKKRS